MPAHTTSPTISAEMQKCIRDCQECHAVCLASVQHCLSMGGAHTTTAHIGLLLDCASICQTSAHFMLLGSERHGLICGVCAEICEECAKDCERFGDDQVMQQCAGVCRRCADSCRRMANAA